MKIVTSVVTLVLLGASSAPAQEWVPPADTARCPSKWGAGDQRGSGNHMKPDSVLRAMRLVRTGEVIDLGHVLNPSIPIFGPRRFNLFTKRTAENAGVNRRGGNEELIVSEITQVGTQLDGFTHQTIGDSLYNCLKMGDVATRDGFKEMGIEKVGSLITRGVLIDVAALKGVEHVGDTYEVTAQDLQQALARQKMTLQPGDAVVIHTGWGRLWGKDNRRYEKSRPGIGVDAAQWLIKQDPMLVGADNSGVEVDPSPDPRLNGPVHQIFLVVNGVHLVENLKLDELADKRIYEFAFFMQPLKIQGATGSPVVPIAIR
jgi:kynurenine formamidase